MNNDLVSPWVQRFAPLVPGGEVLDLACGRGRHSRHLVGLGHAVIAVDRDPASSPATSTWKATALCGRSARTALPASS
jgi:predicted RNA methylase